MKTRFALLILALLATMGVYAGNDSDSIYEEDPYFILMGEADRAISEENWPEAAARLCDAMAVKPNSPSNVLLLNNLATVYTYIGNDSLALATYDRALDIAPSMLTVINGKGKLLLKLGRDYEAYELFSRGIEIDSISTTARYYHGMMALYGGKREIAEKDFDVLNRVAPKSYDTAVALSTLYSLTGRDKEAIPYLKRLIEADPAAEYYSNLAGCLLVTNDLGEASEIISEGIEKYPNDPELYYYKAWLNRDRYLLDDAQRDAKRAIELGASPTKVKALFEQR